MRRRSPLFVPAIRPELAAKATRSGPDAVILDLEDAVPAAAKGEARGRLAASVGELAPHVPVWVRVNPPGSAWFADDVAALPSAVQAVVVPKFSTVAQRDHLAEVVDGRAVVAGIETVVGVVDARLLLREPVVACYFGAEDYVADLGGVRTPGNAEVAVARAQVAMAARLAGVVALDMVTIDFGDHERFRTEAGEARALGYSGKLCIHPGQVPLANEAFLPSEEEVDWARRLLAAFAEAEGRTIAFEGLMVDQVVAERARAVLATAEQP